MAFVPSSGLPVFQAGYPIDGAQVFAFDAGATTPRDLFTSADLTTKHPVPVVTVDGVLPAMWAGQGDYDLAIFGPDDGLIRRIRGLAGDPVSAAASGVFDPNAQLSTGDVVFKHGTGSRTGWVRCNGLTIGSAASIATERANDDCHALFVYLWVQDPSLTVSGGRGPAGPEADWQANKTIALPNDQNRFTLGAGDMGNAAAAANLTGGLIPNGTGLGKTGGEAAHALAAAEVGGAVTVTTSGATQVVTPAGGAPHNTLPPFIARTAYMKL